MSILRDLSLQQRFLVSEFSVLAWAASVQRSNLYSERSSQNKASLKEFRRSVLKHLDESLLPTYRRRCTEEHHVTQIEALIAFGSGVGALLLGEYGYKFAVAQKLLNLQLK